MYVECSLVPVLKVWVAWGKREKKKNGKKQLGKGSRISPLTGI